MATESEVADTEGSTATGAPLKKIGNGRSSFPCVPSHNNKSGGKKVKRGMSDSKWKMKLNRNFCKPTIYSCCVMITCITRDG